MNDPHLLAVIEEGGYKVSLIDKRKPNLEVGYLN